MIEWVKGKYVCGDEIRDKSILGAIIFLDGRSNSTLQDLVPQRRSIYLQTGPGRIHIMAWFFSGRNSAGCLVVDVFAPRDVGEVVLLLFHGRHCGANA